MGFPDVMQLYFSCLASCTTCMWQRASVSCIKLLHRVASCAFKLVLPSSLLYLSRLSHNASAIVCILHIAPTNDYLHVFPVSLRLSHYVSNGSLQTTALDVAIPMHLQGQAPKMVEDEHSGGAPRMMFTLLTKKKQQPLAVPMDAAFADRMRQQQEVRFLSLSVYVSLCLSPLFLPLFLSMFIYIYIIYIICVCLSVCM